MATNDVRWLAQRIEKAREAEQVYEASKEVHGEAWTSQAEQLLEQVRSDRVYMECVLEEALCLQSKS